MSTRFTSLRRKIGLIAFVIALALILWLPLSVLDLVPFVITLPGEPGLRSHAGAAVGCLLVAAWGFWEQ